MSDCRFGVSPVNYPDPDPLSPHSSLTYHTLPQGTLKKSGRNDPPNLAETNQGRNDPGPKRLRAKTTRDLQIPSYAWPERQTNCEMVWAELTVSNASKLLACSYYRLILMMIPLCHFSMNLLSRINLLHAEVSYISMSPATGLFFPILPVLATFWNAKTSVFFSISQLPIFAKP